MDKKKQNDGPISLGLGSLRAQMNTLLEEAGGDRVIELLDALCHISDKEQNIILGIFSRVLDKIANGDIRIQQSKSELEAFEDALYSDLIESIQNLEREKYSMKLEVLQGGKTKAKNVVDIEDLRRAKKLSH